MGSQSRPKRGRDNRAIVVGAAIVVVGTFVFGFAGADARVLLAIYGLAGGIAGAISHNFESEHFDAAIGTIAGFLLTAVVIAFLKESMLPESFFPSVTFYVPVRFLFNTLLAIPFVAIIAIVAGLVGRRVRIHAAG